MKGSILAEEGLHSVLGDSTVLQEFTSMPPNAKDGHSSHSSIIQSRSQSTATYSFESSLDRSCGSWVNCLLSQVHRGTFALFCLRRCFVLCRKIMQVLFSRFTVSVQLLSRECTYATCVSPNLI